ncbi:MAG: FtsX-like permease family protein [Hominenteromicrobium sp.]
MRMTKTLKKNIRRSITGSLGRYVAILLIVMLGVAFLTGLRLTRPSMSATETDYVRRTALYDLRLLSTIGFDEDDVRAVSESGNVTAAAGSVSADFIWVRDGEEFVYRAHMLTDEINRPELIAGRMPERADECVVDAARFSEDMIGQKVVLSDTNDADTLDIFASRTYTITGLVDSPLYISVERGTTSLGNGSLSGFVLIPQAGFDSEYYTELYVKCTDEFELYSDEYDDFIEALSDTVEADAVLSVQTRFDGLVADGEQEIADAETELADKKAEAEAELDDAKRKLDDARAEIADGDAELRDAKQQLDDAKRRLDDGAEQLQPGFSSWQSALDAGWSAYRDGQNALNSGIAEGRQQLADSRRQLEEGEAQYEAGKAEYDASLAQYEENLALWEQGYAQYGAALEEYEQNLEAYEQGLAQYEEALAQFNAVKDLLPPETAAEQEAQLEETRLMLEQTAAALEAGKAQLDRTGEELETQKAQLDAAKAQLDESEIQLSQTRTLLDVGWNDYNDGAALLERQQAGQQAKLDAAYAALIEFRDGIDAYNEGLAAYNEGVDSLAQGRTDYEEGLRDYEEGRAEFDEEIADAEAKIADARQELADLSDPELYVLTRDANTGYVTFESDSQIVERLASLFPIFFFLIAALVCSTTMTRMVDDDRTQIGTLRALGYSRASILAKYLLYSGSAASIGCLIGYFGGGYLFPLVIWTAYGMLYKIPGFISVYDPVLFVIALLASLLCSAGTTYLACRHEMRSTPADLIRPKSPDAGKRILLERVTPLWKRLKFLHKVTLRNIFRFKKRMFMMILGIAGCTALVLTGFGIHDSVANIANFQFDDIQKYDISVTLTDPITDAWTADVEAEHGADMDTHAVTLMSAGELTGSAATKSVYLVASDDPHITDIIDLHLSGSTVPYPGDGEIVITEKLASLAGVKVGDTVTVSVSDTDKAQLRVAGLAENYVYNYIYMTGATYDRAFDQAFEPKTLLLRTGEDVDEYGLAASFSNRDGVASVSVVSDTRRMIDKMMMSLNYVVALVLACAGALAFIVLFNLGNINISERVREIATIKVLGFHSRETGAYVFRENIILSMMGIVCGLPLGVALHAFVMSQITVDMVAFKYVIEPVSFLLTVLMVVLFTVITDLIMRRKIARIDMAESLKSIE